MPGTYKRTPEMKEKMRRAACAYFKKRRKRGLPSYLKGRKMSEEARAHLRDAQLRSQKKRRDRGIPHPLSGRVVPEAIRKRMRAGHVGKHACGARCPNWKGGRKINGRYYMVLQPHHPFANSSGYILEHRLVMEKILGRFLRPEEVVHHINGKGRDNREENLQLFKDNHSHSLFHAKPHFRDTSLLPLEKCSS